MEEAAAMQPLLVNGEMMNQYVQYCNCRTLLYVIKTNTNSISEMPSNA